MIPDDAILKAMEGGYRPPPKELTEWQYHALNFTFWQCLGKTLGWTVPDAWLYEAHRFTAVVLTAGNIKKFWQDNGIKV